MDPQLEDIIHKSTFTVVEGKFVYTKVSAAPPIDKHFLVSKDANEITVVTKEENLYSLDLIERNKDDYCLISLNVSIPFYSVGFLAMVSTATAKSGMDILIISTYSKDYIMVRHDLLEKEKEILIGLGLNEE